MEINTEAIAEAASAASFSGVVSVDVGDVPIFQHCAGFAHRAHQIPNTASTRFAIASGSKGFTALAVMQLVDAGVMPLDQPVRTVLDGDLPLIDDRVTIAHLLQHTSGIGDYLDENSDWQVDDYVLTLPVHTLITAQSFLPLLDGLAQVFTPGTQFAYNNGGYVVLGIVIERLTGQPFQDAIETRVLAPVGLSATGFLRLDELPASAALGYLHETGDRVNTLHLPVRGSADGGAFTTVADIHSFWRALFAGRIVAPETVTLMTTPLHLDPREDLHYGMGFYLDRTGGTAILEGYDAGASFMTWHLIEAETTITVASNTSEGAWQVAQAVSAELDKRAPA